LTIVSSAGALAMQPEVAVVGQAVSPARGDRLDPWANPAVFAAQPTAAPKKTKTPPPEALRPKGSLKEA